MQLIAEALKNIRETDASYLDVLGYLTGKESLLKLVNEIIENEALRILIARRSYMHSNGFYKIILYDTPKYKVRIHIWPPSEVSVIPENIHYHRWRFVSRILLGAYNCYDFKVDSSGQIMKKYIYQPRQGRDEYDLKYIGEEALVVIRHKQLQKNDFLISKPLELHRVVPIRTLFTASMMLQGKDELSFTTVYNENELVQNIASPAIPPDELKDLMIVFTKILQESFN